MSRLPVSVIIVTKNEAHRIGKCITALNPYFNDIWVVDSRSRDKTREIASAYGAKIEDYVWNGYYPKKRQWSMEALDLAYDWVLFIDADELMEEALAQEIGALDLSQGSAFAGYFIKGRYIWDGKVLSHGLMNNKLALLHRRKMAFPEVDDLSLPGMGEIEGHYQPVLREGFEGCRIGQLHVPLLHDAGQGWRARHLRYAMWEAGMNDLNAWPHDPLPERQRKKEKFRALPMRGFAAFVHSYIFKLGFLDGLAGFDFALSRWSYYRMISRASKDLAGVNAETM